jgi:chemotaxis signal transduction protein
VKNVLVIALGTDRQAIELRWIREIFTLGALTPVPTAPQVIAGAVNFRGAVLPVLDGTQLLLALGLPAPAGARPPREGDPVVLLDVGGTRAALAADRIDAVTTLVATDQGLMDPRGAVLPILDPPSVVAAVRRVVTEAAEQTPGAERRP